MISEYILEKNNCTQFRPYRINGHNLILDNEIY